MKKDYTHISIIIDRSGSMTTMTKEVISGFNNLLNIKYSLIQYDYPF